jgi:NTP pyrophosphatase (non-canonical NTP hydrolase)
MAELKEQLDKVLREHVLNEVNLERDRQNVKWGRQRHSDGDWLKILAEEFGEVAQAMQQDLGWSKDSDASDQYTELIQLAAVAVAMAEQLLEEKSSKSIEWDSM